MEEARSSPTEPFPETPGACRPAPDRDRAPVHIHGSFASAGSHQRRRKISELISLMVRSAAPFLICGKKRSKNAVGIFLKRRNLSLFFRFPELESDHEGGKDKEDRHQGLEKASHFLLIVFFFYFLQKEGESQWAKLQELTHFFYCRKPGPVMAEPMTPSRQTHPTASMSFGCYGPGRATRAPVSG